MSRTDRERDHLNDGDYGYWCLWTLLRSRLYWAISLLRQLEYRVAVAPLKSMPIPECVIGLRTARILIFTVKTLLGLEIAGKLIRHFDVG